MGLNVSSDNEVVTFDSGGNLEGGGFLSRDVERFGDVVDRHGAR